MSRDTRFEPVEIKQAIEEGIRGPRGGPGFPNAIYYDALHATRERIDARILANIWGGNAIRSKAPGSLWPSELDHVPVGKRYDPESKGWR